MQELLLSKVATSDKIFQSTFFWRTTFTERLLLKTTDYDQTGSEVDPGLVKLVMKTNVFSITNNTKLKLNGSYALNR